MREGEGEGVREGEGREWWAVREGEAMRVGKGVVGSTYCIHQGQRSASYVMGAHPHLLMVRVGAHSQTIVGGGWAFVTVQQLDVFIIGGKDLTCSQGVLCWV